MQYSHVEARACTNDATGNTGSTDVGTAHLAGPVNGILNLVHEHNLVAAANVFDNNHKYNTCLGIPNPATGKRKAYQIDHIFVPHQQLCQTTNIKRKFNGVTSVHAAMFIEFKLLNAPFRKSNQQRDQIIHEPPPQNRQLQP
jgi:hypothetical protein